MADLTITATNLIAGANANIQTGISSEAIPAGKSIIVDPDTKKVMLADSDAGDTDLHDAKGISLNAAVAANQPVSWIKDGDLAMGAILTKGVTYCVSSTPGGICPQADVTSGRELVILGVASSTSNLQVGVRDTNIVI